MPRAVAYLTSHYARAGDTFIRREVAELRRRGWTVHTFSIRRAAPEERISDDIAREQETTDYILERGAPALAAALARAALRSPGRLRRAIAQAAAIRAPGLRSWAWHWIYLLEAAYLSEQLVRRDVELLHDHIAMNSATVAMLASTLSGVPFSMTVHGSELLDAERWGLARKVASAAATVCISSYGKAQCMLFTPAEHWPRLHVARCGLEESFFSAPRSPAPDCRRIVCVGRLSPEKGQLLLVDVAARLAAWGLDGVEIVLVGDGPSRSELERKARALGVAHLLRLVGWRSTDEVRRWISGSRALVLPSFNEGIPVVLMEAMALERPVVATWVGGIPELVRPGENGWLVPPGSVDELAAAMRAVLETPVPELRAMGERGRRRVLEQHDLRSEAAKLAALFERAVGATQAPLRRTSARPEPAPAAGPVTRPARTPRRDRAR